LVSSEFGKTYPVIIDGKKIYTSQTVIRTSPTDRGITLLTVCAQNMGRQKSESNIITNIAYLVVEIGIYRLTR
jgi:hypothetical protein